jgi:hypothetical protein
MVGVGARDEADGLNGTGHELSEELGGELELRWSRGRAGELQSATVRNGNKDGEGEKNLQLTRMDYPQ